MKFKAIAPMVLLAMLVVLVPSASATIIGTLNLDGGPEGVIVGATTIDWTPVGGPTGTFVSSAFTNMTHDAGVPIGVGVGGVMMDLSAPTVFPVADFITFPTIPGLTFDLRTIGPGSSNTDCSGTANVVCSIFAGSPFVLTQNAGGTAVALSVSGKVTDSSGDVSNWIGLYSTQITRVNGIGPVATPAEIQNDFLTNPSFAISSSYSATIDATPVTIPGVPEPSTAMMALAGFGLLFLGRIRLRNRKS